MKTSLTALAAILALTISGCGPALVPPSEKSVNNGSGAKMEQVSQSGFARLMFRDKSTPVNVPAKTVLKRLSAFAKQCIQARTVVIESVGGSGYGRGYSRTDLHFRAHVAQEDGIDRLLILGGTDTSNLVIGDKDGFNVLTTTQVIPNGDATILKTRHLVFWGRLHTTAVEWASGETSVCPDLKKLYRP